MAASVEKANSGTCSGDEIVQVYVPDVTASVPAANHSLRGFAGVQLARGQTKQVKFKLPYEAFSIVDEWGNRMVEPGEFEILLGGGQLGFADGVIVKIHLTPERNL